MMNKKRKLLIETALQLFYRNGINSIGINEILKVSGVAKQTLYSHFDGKESLILAALAHRHSRFMAWLADNTSGAEDNAQFITQLFNALQAWFDGSDDTLGDFRGCFFVNSAAEFGDSECAIAQYCQQHKQAVHALIIAQMPTENSVLADAICIMKEGAISTAYVSGDHRVARRCAAILHSM